MKGIKLVLVVLVIAFLAFTSTVLAGETFDAVKAKGFVTVGVNGALFGFGQPDDKGVWRGLDVDTGRAIAVAVFGDANKVKWVPLTAVQRCFVPQLHAHADSGYGPGPRLCASELL
jgi:general L-amino acid transport system substrate-binding protein